MSIWKDENAELLMRARGYLASYSVTDPAGGTYALLKDLIAEIEKLRGLIK